MSEADRKRPKGYADRLALIGLVLVLLLTVALIVWFVLWNTLGSGSG